MDNKLGFKRIPLLRARLIAIVLLGAIFLALPSAAEAHSPTPFIASPYYGTSGYNRRWIIGIHYGIDFLLSYQPVLAAAGGTIEFSGWYNPACHDESMPGCGTISQSGFGLHVRINHGPSGASSLFL
jgi:murein DD-endopeptidase MepM/ murein hydrolase activator NlpD